MITIKEFSQYRKHQMVVTIVERMVQDGWDISGFLLNFRSYQKSELIQMYEEKLKYNETLK